MNANDFGKKLGIGVRVAGRIAQQRAQQHAQEAARAKNEQKLHPEYDSSPRSVPGVRDIRELPEIREIKEKSHKLTRAAGRGVGGFLRPFSRVGGILWLEVTGFFFGLFALYFAQDVWRVRQSYAAGPQHVHFLISAIATAVFVYLSVSAFWRARRR